MQKNDIHLLIADDHPLLLEGLKNALHTHGYSHIVAVENGALALDYIKEEQPHVALLDIEMPLLTGFEVIKKCQALSVTTRFIILTSHKEKGFVLKAKKLNIAGYIIKDEPFMEIDKCIQEVAAGNTYFSATFDAVFEGEISPQLQKVKLLSPSERTILRLIAQNKNSKEIAELLSISVRTVQKHRANIIAKLELPTGLDSLSVWTQEHQELILSI
ncbi:response regulator transcription factor [uncultured Dokdonia sp.]|uniref:response regulator n=1 Tax=uncultured Dokdonia sp. TaxID=575653 RepID=UPI002636D1BF|nr:response regulator transcription factor [uncultured Dokdonia sp.]